MSSAKTRSIAFCVVVSLAMAGAVLWVQEDRVQPLLTPPSSPPPGLNMS